MVNDWPSQDTETISFVPDQLCEKSGLPIVTWIGIVWHPDRSRIGAVAPLLYGSGDQTPISRTDLLFSGVSQPEAMPLMDRHVSRTPIYVKRLRGRLYEISPPASKMQVTVNGKTIDGPTRVSLDELGGDIILSLSGHVILSIFEQAVDAYGDVEDYGIVGISGEMRLLRGSIENVAPSDVPVLIRGETGTGKELVAEALHTLGSRAGREMLTVNMSTLAPELAAAELFGVEKGAFTGANQNRVGLFEHANDSSIFLDEIGNVPEIVQPMLLRTLELGEIRRVGSSKVSRTTARIIAATDQSLEGAGFSQPLLQRLERYVITVPPLRRRRVDVGLLILHFLRQSQGANAVDEFLEIPADWVLKLLLHDWPGNVRELKNIVEQLVIGGSGNLPLPQVRDRHSSNPPQTEPANKVLRRNYRDSTDVSDEEILKALDQSNWQIKDAAALLGLSRGTFYNLMRTCPEIRQIEDVSETDIEMVMTQHPGNLNEWAKELHVGKSALKRHIKKLGL